MLRNVLTIAIVAMFVTSASAVINPGDVRYRPGSTNSTGPNDYTQSGVPANYSVLLASMTNNLHDFDPDVYDGTVTSQVWQDPGTGFLAFEYWFTIDDTSTEDTPAVRATIGGDWGIANVLEVGSDNSGSATYGGWGLGQGADPVQMGLGFFSASPEVLFFDSNNAEGVGFLPDAGNPDDVSAHFWYATDALTYGVDFLGLQDGGDVDRVPVFVVPAPAAVLLAGLGLPMVGWVRRKFA